MTLTALMGPYSLYEWLSRSWLLISEEIPKFGQCSKGPVVADFSVNLARPWYSAILKVVLFFVFCFVSNELTFSISRAGGKQITLRKGGRRHPIIWRASLEKNWPPPKMRKFCLQTAFGLELQHQIFPVPAQAARVPCRFWAYQSPKLCEPIASNKLTPILSPRQIDRHIDDIDIVTDPRWFYFFG